MWAGMKIAIIICVEGVLLLIGWGVDRMDHLIPTWAIFTTAGVFMILLPFLAFEAWRRPFVFFFTGKRHTGPPLEEDPFDVPILDAIHHIARTMPTSYLGSGAVERHIFGVLHRQMCEGKLPVMGKLGEDGDLERLSREQCKRLVPQEVVVPLHPTSPNGVMFSLIDADTLEERKKSLLSRKLDGYIGLRVRSRDLYRMWPKNHELSPTGKTGPLCVDHPPA